MTLTDTTTAAPVTCGCPGTSCALLHERYDIIPLATRAAVQTAHFHEGLDAPTAEARLAATLVSHGHTPKDEAALAPLGLLHSTQPRERGVPCGNCRADTWNAAGFCDLHYREPAVTNRARR